MASLRRFTIFTLISVSNKYRRGLPMNDMQFLIVKFRRALLNCLIRFFQIFPIEQHKIFFVSYYGRGFGDNGKAIILSLKEKGKIYRFYWAVKKGEEDNFPDFVKPVRYLSISYFYHLATSKIWVDNARKNIYVAKRKQQYYIQTWHGDPMLKKIEKDAEDALGPDYVKLAKHDSTMTDLVIANSDFGVKLFTNRFWYTGEVWKAGSPRLDMLKKEDPLLTKSIYRKLQISENKKILLYAPTFRDDHNISCYSLDYPLLRSTLENQWGGGWVILVRLHPNIGKKEVETVKITYCDWLIDASSYDDMYELLRVSTMLITDYSSTMFEAASIQLPVFLYAADRASYINDRGFYFEYEKLPFPQAETMDELVEVIEAFNFSFYQKCVMDFCRQLGILEPGGAASRIASRIIEIMEKGNF